MKAAIFASILAAFTGLVSSVPVPGTELEARAPIFLYPKLIVNIRENETPPSGPSNTAEVQRINGAKNGQALLSYEFPSGKAGLMCELFFSGSTAATGSKKVQVFTVGGAILPTSTFTRRPYRDQYKGAFNAPAGTWDSPGVPKFPCPTAAVTLGFEAVPQNDNDFVSWPITAGLAIKIG